ncbi:MAG TPA: VacJ family lipoprotein [Methylophilaceae bacterium]|jgi:phospholipid-binding lipoprotein MlaA
MRIKSFTTSIIICAALMISGCATTGNKDPYEGYNRAVYKFNDVADKAVIKPIAGAYKAVTPPPIKTGVSNFFSNIGTLITAINDLLQFKLSKAMTDIGRFAINTTVGIGGLIDVASMDGIPQNHEDFGQTLAVWGVGDGGFTVLPFFGPSTLRDTAGLVVDTYAFDPVSYINDVRARNQTRLLRGLDTRANLLPASDLIDDAALDPYAFMRDAYMQHRKIEIQDGAGKSEFPQEEDGIDNAPAQPEPAPTKSEAAPAANAPTSADATLPAAIPVAGDADKTNATTLATTAQ